MSDTSPEWVNRVCSAAPFADNDAGIPEMVSLIRALAAERDALAARVKAADELAEAVQRESDNFGIPEFMEDALAAYRATQEQDTWH